MAFNQANLQLLAASSAGASRIWSYYANSDSFATVKAAGYFDTADNIANIQTGDKVLISGNISYTATFVNDGTNVTLSFNNGVSVFAKLADISTAETVYLPMPVAGEIVKTFAVQFAAVTVASSVISFSVGGSALTGGSLTVTTAGTAGTQYNATPTANTTVTTSTVVSAATDGGSTTAAAGMVGVLVLPTV